MKKRDKKVQRGKRIGIIFWSLFFVFGGLMALSVVGLSQTMQDISNNVISRTPDAILASAGISEEREVSLPVAYYDQRSDECVNIYDSGQELENRQFEWTECGYYKKAIERGLADFYLGENYLPIAKGGELISNRGVNDFTRWFSSVEGKSKEYSGVLKLKYTSEGAEFSYSSEKFYPLDEVDFSAGDIVNRDGRNHLFTMSFATPFTPLLSGEESFEITADDDTFVFAGNELVIDMGGIHEGTTGKLLVHENGEIYSGVEGEELAYSGVKLIKNESSIIRIFHADRDSSESVFKLRFREMNLNVVDTKIASSGDDGVQIAYDPSDPSYVSPLGESLTIRPDGTKGYIVMATTFGVMIIVFAVAIMAVTKALVRRKTGS